MKKLLIFLGVLAAILAAVLFLPVEVTENGQYIVFGRKLGKKRGRSRTDRVICTDTPIGIFADRFRAKKRVLRTENKDCVSCDDCVSCEDCWDCTDCSGCLGCEECDDCMDCVDCVDCEGCNDCVDCVDCVDCDDCESCYGLVGVTGAKGKSTLRRFDGNDGKKEAAK